MQVSEDSDQNDKFNKLETQVKALENEYKERCEEKQKFLAEQEKDKARMRRSSMIEWKSIDKRSKKRISTKRRIYAERYRVKKQPSSADSILEDAQQMNQLRSEANTLKEDRFDLEIELAALKNQDQSLTRKAADHEEELNKDIHRYSLNELLTSDIVTDEWLQMIRQEIRFIQQSFERNAVSQVEQYEKDCKLILTAVRNVKLVK